jgi:hypothetical protein
MLEDIGKIVVLGLEKRTDRRARCEQIFRTHGITDYTYFGTKEDPSDVYGNASRDFLKMIEKHFDGEFTVFFEDDFELAPDYEAVLEKAWLDLPEDFDLLYLGANLTAPAERVTDNLVKLGGAWTVHAIIWQRKFAEYVLQNYRYETCGVFDEWLRKLNKNFYMTYPMVSWQRPGFSNFVKADVNYNLFKNPYYQTL